LQVNVFVPLDDASRASSRSHLQARGDVTADLTAFTDSSIQGRQSWSQEQAKHELRATSEAHKHSIELERQKHELREATKDNAQRRLAFNVVVGVLLAILVVSLFLAIQSENGTTRAWAQGVVSSVMGGIVGAVAGYFTGKSGK
jgi:hypothetical protein